MVEGENKRFREENERQRGELQALRAEVRACGQCWDGSHSLMLPERAGFDGELPSLYAAEREQLPCPEWVREGRRRTARL